jgi:putative endonuclease
VSVPPVTLVTVEAASHLELGRAGEDAALRWYEQRDYELVARNWRCRLGELDLVLSGGGVLVFCEVKCRRGSAFGMPYEAVNHVKQRKLRALAEAFVDSRRTAVEAVRFDVASVSVDRTGGHHVHVFDDAF